MDAKQRRVMIALLLTFVAASACLWVWYAYEKSKIEIEGRRQFEETVRLVIDCEKQMPSGNLTQKCKEPLGGK